MRSLAAAHRRRFAPRLEILEDRCAPAALTGGTGPGGFLLANGTSNLTLWLDAVTTSSIVTSGSNVSQWSDLSGYGNNATQPTAGLQPSLVPGALNGQQAIRLIPGQYLLPPNTFTVTIPYDVYVVDQYSGANHGRNVDSRDTNWLIGKWSDHNDHYDNGWVSTGNNAADGLSTPVANFAPVIGNGTNNSALNSAFYYRNGLDVTTDHSPHSDAGRLEIGRISGEQSNADISELIVFNRVLNSAERDIVDNYLSTRFNITINPTSGEVVYAGTYKNNLFGIGEVDAADVVTTAGADGFGIQATSLAPGQFIFAADTAGSNSIVSTGVPITALQRWSRVWNVTPIGSPNGGTLTFDLNNGGGVAAAPFGYTLLYSATDPNQGGTFTDLKLTPTVSGSQISFNVPAAMLQKGFFTLGNAKQMADVSIVTTVSQPVRASRPLTYTIVVTNNGPGAASGIGVTDPVPVVLTNATWTATGSAGVTGLPSGPQSGNINLSGLNLPSGGTVTIVLTGVLAANASGSLSNAASLTVPNTIFDPNPSNSTSSTSTVSITPFVPIYAVGADAGGTPLVTVYNGVNHALIAFNAFPLGFKGGVRVAVGDLNGNGVNDVVAAAGPGAGPEVNVYDGTTFQLIGAFYAFVPSFTGGLYVAVGDVFGQGYADIIVGADKGGLSMVEIFDGKTFNLVEAFFPFGQFATGGVRVAAADINGSGRAAIICGSGPGGLSQVSAFDATNLKLLTGIQAFPAFFTGGVYVAGGDVFGTGQADIIVGAGAGAGPLVEVFDGAGNLILAYFAEPIGFTGGVRVAARDLTGSGRATIITGAGPGGLAEIAAVDGSTLAVLGAFFAYNPTFHGGVFVG
jgi:uncharacterized repeat protein (TIGR01451 family)